MQSAQVIQDRDTGRSKGFGFVEMGDDNSANEAIRGLHEKDHGGRPLRRLTAAFASIGRA